ncbi:Long chain acyl-CoA synthetase 1 [Platanthera guangdongensis]|uniref:Long chain acyl-CoA synthetase 1 n=1 Tax=Platanthera guangdongensis TaxID=2320717 RepID=A0ABR2MJR8_9ASPA
MQKITVSNNEQIILLNIVVVVSKQQRVVGNAKNYKLRVRDILNDGRRLISRGMVPEKDFWSDIGEITPNGVLIIIDRKKNIFKLSQGEYVGVEYLEKVYSCTSIIEDIWVYGDNYCSMLVALVTPYKDNTQKWAMLNGIKGSFSEICALKELHDYILQELKLAAERNKLRGFEHIRGIVLVPAPFDIEKDMVTTTMKKKRLQLLKKVVFFLIFFSIVALIIFSKFIVA